MGEMITLKASIEESIGWLRHAHNIACMEDVEGYERGGYPVLDALADRLGPILEQLETVLPLDPELEAEVEKEWDYVCAHESPGTGLR
jgi:hypothetical protein